MFIEKRNFYNSIHADSFFMLFISKARIGFVRLMTAFRVAELINVQISLMPALQAL